MSVYVTCPRCHASLKANKLPSGTKTVTCPECKQSFQVASTGVTATPPPPKIAAAVAEVEVNREVAVPRSNRWFAVSAIASILLVGGGIIAAIVFTRQEPQPAPTNPQVVVVKEKDETPKSDENDEKHRQDFIRLMIEGGTSFHGQQFDDAVSAYSAAAKLFPDDADAKQKLGEAQTALGRQRQKKLDDDKARADVVQLVKNGQAALEEKKYAAALEFFKLAVEKDPALADAKQGMINAQAALDHAQLDQKKIDEYTQAMLSGKAALKAGRYADAIRDFLNAQRAVPNDEIAVQFQREAEKQLDAVTDRAEKMKEFQRLMDQANTALRAKSYDDAQKIFERALRLYPNDAAALQGIESAQRFLKSAKVEYAVWMNRGVAASQAGRFADAVFAYREATRIVPGDETANKALRLAELALDNQSIYLRSMEQGALAMTARQYPNAIVAYNEALRVAPGDAAALLGLRDAQSAFEGDALRRKDFERKALAGLQCLKAQRYGDAVTELRAALKIMPKHPDADAVRRQIRYAEAMDKGVSALNARRFNEAITSFQAALDVYPNDFAARNGLNQARQMNKGGKA